MPATTTSRPAVAVATDRARAAHGVRRLSSLILLALVSERLLALGLIALLAALYGASVQSDAYFFALIVPIAIATGLGEGLYTALLQKVADPTERSVRAAARVALPSILPVAAAYVAVLAVARPHQVGVWLAFSPIIVTLSFGSAYAAFVTIERRYLLAVMRVPLATGLGLLAVAAIMPVSRSVTAFAVGITAGHVVSTVALLVVGSQRRPAGLRPLPREATAVSALLAAAPVAVATLVGGQFIIVVERFLASGLAVGAVTLISLARGVALIPVQIAQALGNGVLPAAAEHHRKLDHAAVARLNLLAMRLTFVTALVSAAFIVICRREIVRIALEHGNLSRGDASQTAKLTAVLALSLAGLSAGTVATKALYALGRQRFVATVTACGVVGYAALAVGLRNAAGTTGLAAAFSIAAVATGLALTAWLAHCSRLALGTVLRDWLLAPVLLTAAFAAGGYAGWSPLVTAGAGTARALAAVVACGALGLAVVVAAVVLFRQPEGDLLRSAVHKLRTATPRARTRLGDARG